MQRDDPGNPSELARWSVDTLLKDWGFRFESLYQGFKTFRTKPTKRYLEVAEDLKILSFPVFWKGICFVWKTEINTEVKEYDKKYAKSVAFW